MDEAEQEYRQKIDERFARDKSDINSHDERLSKLDDREEKIEQLSIQMGEMLKAHDNKLTEHDKRIIALEEKPAKRWNEVVNQIITVVVAALLGGFLSQIIKF